MNQRIPTCREDVKIMSPQVAPCWFTYPHRPHDWELSLGTGLWFVCPGRSAGENNPADSKEEVTVERQEFKMVEAATPAGLEEGVNSLLDQGWWIHGGTMMATEPRGLGTASVTCRFVQALIRETGGHE